MELGGTLTSWGPSPPPRGLCSRSPQSSQLPSSWSLRRPSELCAEQGKHSFPGQLRRPMVWGLSRWHWKMRRDVEEESQSQGSLTLEIATIFGTSYTRRF